MAQTSLRNNIHHLNKRLRLMLRLYFLITVFLFGFLFLNIFRHSLDWKYALVGVLAGIGVGVGASRMYHISWDKDAKKVISRIDLYGLIVLILYIAFEFIRGKIVAYFTHDIQVETVGFAVLAGVMLGRVIGMRGKIIQILKEQKVFG